VPNIKHGHTKNIFIGMYDVPIRESRSTYCTTR
jgi:hypothetical protein